MKYGTLNPDNLCRVLEGIFSERDSSTVIKASLSSEKTIECRAEGEQIGSGQEMPEVAEAPSPERCAYCPGAKCFD